MNKNIHSHIYNNTFKDYSETVWVYLKKTNTKGANYNTFTDTGYTKTQQSPFPIKAIVHPLSGNSLVARELGLVASGSIELIIKAKDIGFFKQAEKIKYDDEIYSVYNKALGNTIQLTKRPFGFYRVMLFLVGNS